MKLPKRRLSIFALGALASIAVAGCDLQENADLDNGRELFNANCGNCHILAEAGSTADIGPDLDSAFAASRAAGMDNDTIEGVVEMQIANPRLPAGPNPEADPTYMPADLVVGDEARDVAAYVASVAGVPGAAPPQVPGGPGAQVFANNGCGNCHVIASVGSAGQTGPNLDEALEGQSADQVLDSIINPEANITAGFPSGVMPANYGDTISQEDLDLLVDFLVNGPSDDSETAAGE